MSDTDFIKRVMIERDELEKKYIALGSFLQLGKHNDLSPNHSNLLQMQFNAMGMYLNILEMRLATLPKVK